MVESKQKPISKAIGNNNVIELLKDKFVIVDEKMSYQMKGNVLFLKIDLPKDLEDVIDDDLLSSTGKTYRVYSNSTNRKFIKNKDYKHVQMQINSYLSVKDAEKL